MAIGVSVRHWCMRISFVDGYLVTHFEGSAKKVECSRSPGGKQLSQPTRGRGGRVRYRESPAVLAAAT